MADTKISALTDGGAIQATDQFVVARTGSNFKIAGSEVVSGMAYVQVRDEKTQNTQGGNFTSGAWRTRTLNTESADTGAVCTLASNQITLDAGTYVCRISCPAGYCGKHQARLQNVTDATTVLVGTSEYSGSANTDLVQSHSFISGEFTIGASKALEVQHQCLTTRNTDGFGVAANFTTEVYTVAEFWKVA